MHSDTTLDPMCVRAANALVRLCISPGSSELLIVAFITDSCVLLVGMCFKKFLGFVPEVEAISCLTKQILARDQSTFCTK